MSESPILDPTGAPYRSEEPLEKGWKKLPQERPQSAPKSAMYDPMTLMYSLGYKDRRFSLTYDSIRQVTRQLSLSVAIIKHRINQVTQFCTPYRYTHNTTGVGFEIKHKDSDRPMSASEKRFARELENFILYCGNPSPNKHTGKRRPDFESFTKMFLRDLLELDQGTFEVVPTRSRLPYEFLAVDGATIRLAADTQKGNKQNRTLQGEAIRTMYNPLGKRGNWPQYDQRSAAFADQIAYVQVVRGQIETLYKDDEMGFCLQNPRTNLMANGYGESNTEVLIRAITAHLYAEQHNMNVFRQGSFPKGILNIVGENMDPKQLEVFRRQWTAQIAGVENSWKTPVVSGPDLQYIPFQGTNVEMEFQNWMNYLIRLQCAVWLIDPAEVGFELSTSQGQFAPPNFETPQEWKLKKSKDRGLRPLLRYYAYALNTNVIDRIDDHFYIDFVGLDELDQKDKIEILQQETMVYKMVNEAREEQGMEPVEDGDIILNPTLLQYKQMKMNEKMMEEQAQQGGGDPQQAAAQDKEAQQHMEPPAPEEMAQGTRPPTALPPGAEQAAAPMGKSLGWQEALGDEDLQARIDHIRGYVEIIE